MEPVQNPDREGPRSGSEADSSARASISVTDKSTKELIEELPVDDAAAVGLAAAAAREAQPKWAAIPPRQRAVLLKRARKSLVAARSEILDVLERETGKPRFDVVGELMSVCMDIGYFARRTRVWLRTRRVSTRPLFGKRGRIFMKPRGLVGVIGPWNAPLTLTLGDAIPALLAGNAVIVKPSEITPLAVRRAVEALNQVLPKGVLQVVVGAGETGAALVDQVDMIAVTGSPGTGRRVMRQASERLTPVLLELGGKDPMIVLRDANIERAARAAAWGSCFMTGQVCMSIERVYVEEPAAEAFRHALVEQMGQLRVGPNGPNANIDLGPFTGPRQIEIIEAQLEDAREKGAEVVLGGRRAAADAGGDFYEPTLVAGVDHSMRMMREETFGPMLGLMVVKDAEEAVQLANDSEFGLNASVWTQDIERGIQLAQRLETGNVCVNDCVLSAGVLSLPFGGVKQSGVGARHGGPEGLLQFCVRQSVMIEKRDRLRESAWFPYDPKRTEKFEKVLAWMFDR
ncbi:MAG: aldehyde dehydrogenase family protein [Deltaproteobacteria bacterium]|nr:aldehyde dehydrogenase family protein [Deltaproteobacteria bacterium]